MPPPGVGTWSKPIIDASENDSVRHTVWNCDPLITHLCLLREVAGRNAFSLALVAADRPAIRSDTLWRERTIEKSQQIQRGITSPVSANSS